MFVGTSFGDKDRSFGQKSSLLMKLYVGGRRIGNRRGGWVWKADKRLYDLLLVKKILNEKEKR